MWLTDGFLVTFFGRWRGAVRIHVSHVLLPCTVNSCVVVGTIYTYMCTYSCRTWCTVHGELMCGGGDNIRIHMYIQLPYTVYHAWWTHMWWWGQYTHTYVHTAAIHDVLCTVNSRVVVGTIYAYICTYSCRTRCTVHGELTCGGGGNIRIHMYIQLPYMVCRARWTHVWWWGQYTHTYVHTATVHGVPYTVNSCVVVGAIYAYICTYSCRTWCTMHGELTCGGGDNIRIHMYIQLPYTMYRAQWTHMWWWGQYTHTYVHTAAVHGVPCTVNSCVVVGAIYAYICTYSCCTRCAMHGELTCGGGDNIRIHMYIQLPYTVYRTQCTCTVITHVNTGV